MTDTLTACARAMAEDEGFAWDLEPGKYVGNPARKDMWLSRAQACLTALSENVSEEMVEAADRAHSNAGCMFYEGADAADILDAMIRAAVGDRG